MATPAMTHTPIGACEAGSGSDLFFMVTGEDDITDSQAKDYIGDIHYRESGGPGYQFCTSFSAWRQGADDNRVIVVAHVRYDV
jgi:hypothetical protein